ncbi:MAG: hypothetical protein CO093_00665 [Alphaproteobacteria bacterium CG_4_9_14_3_um_filter_47_13]|nr:MAG: hypothetical protein CO093_00665 [Alphaproteobacteria bacterium CG_4_9_14_3_um_filter_47_13]
MSVISHEIIDNWKKQYDGNNPLWAKYPQIGRDKADYIKTLVERDRPILHQICLQDTVPAQGRKPVYLATCGAPLAGKSTTLEQIMAVDSERYGNMAKIDPDRWGMALMANTYQDYLMGAGMIADAENYEQAQERAYDIARPGSNYLTLEMLNEAAERKLDIAHGTTMTSPHINTLLSTIKAQGYEIDLLLCSAEDDMRADAQQYRANVQGYYQSTPEDVKSKGIVFPQRMQTYFVMADNLSIFWREGVTENAIKAATYSNGQKTVHNEKAYENFVNKYEADRYTLAYPEQGEALYLCPFSRIEQAYSARHTNTHTSPGGLFLPSIK